MKRTRDDDGSESSNKKQKESHTISTDILDEDSLDENECIDDEFDKQERRKILKEVWVQISTSLRKLEVHVQDRTSNKKPWSNEEYILNVTKIHNLCTLPDCHYFVAKLYKHYSGYLREYLSERLLPQLKDKHNEDMLQNIVYQWKSYRDVFVKFCSRLFNYLDRYYVITAKKNTLKTEGYRLFKEIIFDGLKVQLRNIVRSKLKEDRDLSTTSTVDRSFLKETLLLFLDMGITEDKDWYYYSNDNTQVYTEEIEPYLESDTKQYYHNLSELWLTTCSFTEYLVNSEIKIKEEDFRLNSILTPSYMRKLSNIVDGELLAVNQKKLLEMTGSGVDALIREDKVQDLARLHSLMSRIEDGSAPIAQMFQDFITRVGNEIHEKYTNTSNKEFTSFVKSLLDTYVVELIQFHIKMDQLVTGPFQNNSTFKKALTQGFKNFSNLSFKKNEAHSIKTAQLFAFYCDELLRKRKTENLDEDLEKVVRYVQFFSDKDIFIEEYRKQLAKRLLVSGYQDAEERTMISRLKWHYRGSGDLYKLEKMLSDKTMATDMKQEYVDYVNQNHPDQINIDLTVTVLTMGTWPITLKDSLRVHGSLAVAQNLFKSFYENKYERRVLHWAYGRSTVQLDALFGSSRKTLEISTHQACILLPFNDQEEITISQLMEATSLNFDSVKRTLSSLTSKKYTLLQCLYQDTSDQVVKEDTRVKVNDGFKHKSVKIKIPMTRASEEDVKKTVVNVNNDRVWTLDGTLVRTMKTRKTMNIQLLIKEVIAQVSDKFQPDLKQIKKRIESLIERDYLKRSDDGTSVDYVA
ncbi:cullin [Acrasis kona]|uniref:Cullin n=1 Tax=Acrasis kona TaxID=1008807 RepID=A0AAW2ZFA7_9EUKA